MIPSNHSRKIVRILRKVQVVSCLHYSGVVPDLDLFIVIAGGDPFDVLTRDQQKWIQSISRRVPQIGGVSGGPVVLAQAGLMKGRRMTVHWEHAAMLREVDPALFLDRRLFVIDRDRVTCGGGTAPLDLMHALILEHHGADFARQVSDWFLHTDIRAPADPQRAGLAERLGTWSEPLLDAVTAMENHIADPLSLDHLARLAGVSPRQINRLFDVHLGCSTMAYYRRVRADVAKQMLGRTTLWLTDIALATGFSSSAHFSRVFGEIYGTPPSSIRRGLQ